MFDLAHILLFSILAIASGADSFRKIAIFMEENFETLQESFSLTWKRPPSYNTIRHIVHGINQRETEKVFRKHATSIARFVKGKHTTVGLDGKALRHSFDNVADQKLRHILSAFSPAQNIILAHENIGISKDNEINSAIKVLEKLAIPNALYTLDALHTQKKP